MARIRTIKPEFWADEKLSECSLSARLLFIGLLTFADDQGRFEYRPARIRMQVFPCGSASLEDVTEWLGELSEHSLIRVYEIDSCRFVDIPNFLKHQRINRPTPSKLPEFLSEHSVSPTPGSGTGTGTGTGTGSRLRSSNAVELDDSTDPIKPQIEEVFAHWRTTWQHPRAALDAKRRKLIRERLKQYDVATLCQAITGYTHSPHHCGRNDRNTVYDDLGLLLRDAAHIDAGLRFYANPPRNLSKTTLANIEAAREFLAAGETQP